MAAISTNWLKSLVFAFVIGGVFAAGVNLVMAQADQRNAMIGRATKPWTGDLDGMIKRGVIRVLVVSNLTQYFLDGPQQHGATYEAFKGFEDYLNKKLKTKAKKIQVAFIPARFDQVVPMLVEGHGDVGAANLTITAERDALIDFSEPVLSDIRELVVTGPAAPPVEKIEDLASTEVYVRKSTTYFTHLTKLNEIFSSAGKKQIAVKPIDENLTDEDLLQMINAGLIPATVMDSHKADFWAQIFPNIKVHENIALAEGENIGWAFREGSPKLAAMLNAFIKENASKPIKAVLLQRYFKNTKFARDALSAEDIKKYDATIKIFQKYAPRYDFDYLMIMAQAYQESGLDQSLRNPSGAVGVMQIKPDTANDPHVKVKNVEILDNNILAGVKYLHFVVNTYFNDPTMDPTDRTLFAFAAYNAGPGRIVGLRKRAAKEGLDPNKWFQNVELIAAKSIGRETVQYVGNVYKYYVAYNLYQEQQGAREKAKAATAPQ